MMRSGSVWFSRVSQKEWKVASVTAFPRSPVALTTRAFISPASARHSASARSHPAAPFRTVSPSCWKRIGFHNELEIGPKDNAVWPLSLRDFSSCHSRVEFSGLLLWNGERLPLAASKMLCQVNDLPHMVRIMRDLPVDGLHDGVRLGANGNLSTQVVIAQRRERVENIFPSALPHFHQCGACFRRILEFRVAIAVRLLSVSRQKIRPARAHVSRHVLHDDDDGIRLRIERGKEPLVWALLDRALSEFFVVSENVGGILRIGCRELMCHETIMFSSSELSTPPSKLAIARPS